MSLPPSPQHTPPSSLLLSKCHLESMPQSRPIKPEAVECIYASHHLISISAVSHIRPIPPMPTPFLPAPKQSPLPTTDTSKAHTFYRPHFCLQISGYDSLLPPCHIGVTISAPLRPYSRCDPRFCPPLPLPPVIRVFFWNPRKKVKDEGTDSLGGRGSDVPPPPRPFYLP